MQWKFQSQIVVAELLRSRAVSVKELDVIVAHVLSAHGRHSLLNLAIVGVCTLQNEPATLAVGHGHVVETQITAPVLIECARPSPLPAPVSRRMK